MSALPAARRSFAAGAVIGLLFVFAHVAAAQGESAGVVVENVSPNGAIAAAGIEAGDRLTGWSLAGDKGENAAKSISSPFDVLELEREAQPIQPVEIYAQRGEQAFSVRIGPGRWWTTTRPAWDAETLQRFDGIAGLIDSGDTKSAIDAARSLFETVDAAGDRAAAAWVVAATARGIGRTGDWTTASDSYRWVVNALAGTGHDEAQAYLAYQLGVALMRQSRFEESEAAFRDALLLHRAIDPERLGVAASLIGIGRVAERRSDFESARTHLEEGLWLQEKLAPESLLVASTLNELGRSAASRAKMAEAETYFGRALAIAEKILPGGSEVAGYLNSLAVAAYLQGDIAGAEEKWTRSLAIKEQYEPDSANLAVVLVNIGLVKSKRGDYQEAERYYQRALDIEQRRSPESLESTRTLNNLGVLAMEQGDLAAAERYHLQAYKLRKIAAPDSIDFAASLINLGSVARERGELDRAEIYYLQALDIQSRHAPGDRRQGMIYLNLGELALRRGENDEALTRLLAGLAVFEGIAPAGPGAGEALLRLGNFNLDRDAPDDALGFFTRAREIFEVIAPQSYPVAEAMHGMARVEWQNGDHESARTHFERAVNALDSQHARLGGREETKATVRARYIAVYEDYIEFLLELGEEDYAFGILERSRSKVLSDLLAERDLVFGTDLPPELERKRRMLAYNYETLQARLYETAEADQIADLHASMASIREQQAVLRKEIRTHAPRLADLKYPSPVTISEARTVLTPGTAVISYAVTDARTHAFVLTAAGQLVVHTLPFGADSIDDRVTRLRYLMDAGRWEASPGAGLQTLSASLYRDLLLPLEKNIADADRLLIVPDDALYVLPFAALTRKAAGGQTQFLAEWKPSLVVNSLTVYSQLAPHATQTNAESLVAFGSPEFANSVAAAPETVRNAALRSSLSELPWSRAEVENIGDVYAASATIFTGPDATEERAKSATRNKRYVHFATHALLNESLPLDSSIVLATSEGTGPDAAENGLLQVWEIYENLRLDAALVTLSGCETALGTGYAGEGLIGLTRAFQYAGASTVLASLWSVNDRSTSDLMTHFYSNLADGMPMALALQKAQTTMIHGDAEKGWLDSILGLFSDEDPPAARHPYHWAGFVLHGLGG